MSHRTKHGPASGLAAPGHADPSPHLRQRDPAPLSPRLPVPRRARPQRSMPTSVFGTVIRQMGHLLVDPSADRIWRRIAETQEDAAEQASPRVRLVVDPPR